MNKTKKKYVIPNYPVITEKTVDDEGTIEFLTYCKELGKKTCYGIGGTPDEAYKDFELNKESFLSYLHNNSLAIPLFHH